MLSAGPYHDTILTSWTCCCWTMCAPFYSCCWGAGGRSERITSSPTLLNRTCWWRSLKDKLKLHHNHNNALTEQTFISLTSHFPPPPPPPPSFLLLCMSGSAPKRWLDSNSWLHKLKREPRAWSRWERAKQKNRLGLILSLSLDGEFKRVVEGWMDGMELCSGGHGVEACS